MSHIVVVKSLPVEDIPKQHLTFAYLRFLINYCSSSTSDRCVSHSILKHIGLASFLVEKHSTIGLLLFQWDDLPLFFITPFTECDCMTLQCFWAAPWIDRVGGPTGWQSPQCSWLGLIWFPSSTNLTKICYLIARILHWQKFGCDHIQRPLQQVQDKISPSSWVSWNHALANPMDVPASNRGFQKLRLFW